MISLIFLLLIALVFYKMDKAVDREIQLDFDDSTSYFNRIRQRNKTKHRGN